MDDKMQTSFLFYTTNEGKTSVRVIADSESETIWTTQKGMSEIFGVEVPAISKHLKNIFDDGELIENSVVSKMETTAADGKKYLTNYYNLDAIISVGYRVNSAQATRFRIWATQILKEYMVKGFALDDERLKQGGKVFGRDYFKELVERIREIRASERMFYEKITDLFRDCSSDYDPKSKTTMRFYTDIQNKCHFAIHQHTASELIYERANAEKPYMGLTSWKNEKAGGKIYKSDVIVAKNYLTEDELKNLNRLVNMYLDYAENLAEKHIVFTMEEWTKRLNAFLNFNEYPVLNDFGKIKSDVAKALAEKEYDKFRVVQDKEYKSDFNKLIEESNIMVDADAAQEKLISDKKIDDGEKLMPGQDIN